MSYVDILIPLVPGILLVAFPQMFTKARGDALYRAKSRLRNIGFLLIGVAVIYAVVKIGASVGQ